MASAHFIDTVKKGVRNVHRRLSATLGPWKQLWTRGSQDNKLRPSEFYCLFSISRGQSLLCFSSLQWNTSLKFSWLLRTDLESAHSDQKRAEPILSLGSFCLEDVGVKRDTKKGPFLPLRSSPSNFSFPSSCRLRSTYPCGEEKGGRVCMRELSLSQKQVLPCGVLLVGFLPVSQGKLWAGLNFYSLLSCLRWKILCLERCVSTLMGGLKQLQWVVWLYSVRLSYQARSSQVYAKNAQIAAVWLVRAICCSWQFVFKGNNLTYALLAHSPSYCLTNMSQRICLQLRVNFYKTGFWFFFFKWEEEENVLN
jgi:hypothetical protein